MPPSQGVLAAEAKRKPRTGAVIRVAAGNFLEMYDFTVFGYYASYIGRAYFPKGSEFATLMMAFATFGVGFLMRPVGALVLGAYTDRHGRRKGLILTLALMSFGTVSIACLPGYATIGILATLLIVAGRLVQGLSAGVAMGSVSVYLSEIATPGHKGFYVSWQSASQQCAVICAALLGVTLNSMLSPSQMDDWGWRIPLLVGCLIVPVLYLLMRSIEETEVFLAQKQHFSIGQIMSSVAANWRIVLLGTMLITTSTVVFYVITAYTPTFGKEELHLTDRDGLVVALCVGVSNLILMPLMGALSDRVGRRLPLVTFTIAAILTAYPALWWLARQPSFSHLLIVELWMSFLYAGYHGAVVVWLTEIMPAQVRASGFSVSYSLAAAIFGGFTPTLCTYLIHVTGNKAMPGVWMSFAAAVGLTAVLLVRHSVRRQPAFTYETDKTLVPH
jgi:MFS family permease